ncbi:superoxide dismutase [Actinoplanes sp. NPDC051475]|uniref:superoxide dismutase n=1 Tax=Actinoplanes sp. NPDC051475 TaxID=3157225 RepID=UPI00345055D7
MAATLTRRRLLGFGAALGTGALLGSTGIAAPAPARDRTGWPTTLQLPDGFHPQSIAIGALPYAYFGSLLGGALYRVCLATGAGEVLYPGVNPGVFDPRYMAVGVQVDQRARLFVGGGWGRILKVHDAHDGALLRTYDVGTETTAASHIAVTPGAVWCTDGFNPVLFGLPLGSGGQLPSQQQVITRTLTGDWFQAPDGGVSATGITRTPDGSALLVVNVAADGGSLFRVDPATGIARRVDLPLRLPTTIGVTVRGRTLYATQFDNVAVIELDDAGTRGTFAGYLEDERFDVPCAAQVYGDRLYVTNGRFTVEPTPQTPYNAVAIPLSERRRHS